MIKYLDGKKTFICAALLFIVGGLEAIGALPPDSVGPLKTFLAACGLAALRAAK